MIWRTLGRLVPSQPRSAPQSRRDLSDASLVAGSFDEIITISAITLPRARENHAAVEGFEVPPP